MWLDSVPLLGFCVVVGVSFVAAARAAGVTAGLDSRARGALPALFAHSVVPIVVGYVTAHRATSFVEVGKQTLWCS